MNNIELLSKTVEEQINAQSIDISNTEILNSIERNFYEHDTPKFSTILSNKAVKLIANKIKELEQIKNNLGSSRTNYKQQNAISSNINNLKDLLREVFVLYHLYLKGDEFFQLYEKEENEKYSKYEDEIINGSLDEDILESIMYPTYFDIEKIQNLSNVIKDQIKSLNLDKDNYNYAKDRTISFYNATKDSIYTISKTIDKTNNDLKETKNKLKIIKEDEVYEDNENSINYSLKDYYSELEIDLSFNLDNLEIHKKILTDIFEDLTKNYPYLADSGGFTPSKTTVFGDSNFEVVNQLAFELKDKGFVSNQTTVNDLIEVFTLNEEKPKNKINLMNGTLNDFGYLISKMRESFVDSISNKANYSEWWSERFTFNSKEKTIKDVSNMVAAIKKDRTSAKKETISKIIESLNPIPQ